MDIDRALKEALDLATEMVGHAEGTHTDEGERLAELVLAIDSWLSRGGFQPSRWAHDRKTKT